MCGGGGGRLAVQGSMFVGEGGGGEGGGLFKWQGVGCKRQGAGCPTAGVFARHGAGMGASRGSAWWGLEAEWRMVRLRTEATGVAVAAGKRGLVETVPCTRGSLPDLSRVPMGFQSGF